MLTPSADGKGRTLWDIITGRNKKDLTPQEFKYFNPLEVRVGRVISFDHVEDLIGIHFTVLRLAVYETIVNRQSYYHTDYFLRGLSNDQVQTGNTKPIYLRLRLIREDDAANELGCTIQLLQLFDELAWNDDFHDSVLAADSKDIFIHNDANGEPLEVPDQFFRIDDVFDPYHAEVSVLDDTDKDGEVEECEVQRSSVTYWDYHRTTEDGQFEYLTVEMDNETRYFTMLRGFEVDAYQVMVI